MRVIKIKAHNLYGYINGENAMIRRCLHCNMPLPVLNGMVTYTNKNGLDFNALVLSFETGGKLTLKIFAGTWSPNYVVNSVPYAKEKTADTWRERSVGGP